jgi:hypothetical protein
MLDGTVKTMLVDDSQPVTNLMVVICTKIGTSHTQHKQRNIFVIFIFLVKKEKQGNPFLKSQDD